MTSSLIHQLSLFLHIIQVNDLQIELDNKEYHKEYPKKCPSQLLRLRCSAGSRSLRKPGSDSLAADKPDFGKSAHNAIIQDIFSFLIVTLLFLSVVVAAN